MNTMEIHKAIYQMNSQVTRIDDNLVAFDSDGNVVSFDLAVATQQAAWNRLRQTRNQLLAETDWVTLQALDKSIDGFGIQLPQVWMDYRQALRDLPANTADPTNPVWPTKPEVTQ